MPRRKETPQEKHDRLVRLFREKNLSLAQLRVYENVMHLEAQGKVKPLPEDEDAPQPY